MKHFMSLSNPVQADILEDFFNNIRTKDGIFYLNSTIYSILCGIQRYMNTIEFRKI